MAAHRDDDYSQLDSKNLGLSVRAWNSNPSHRLYKVQISKESRGLLRQLVENILENNVSSFTARHRLVYLSDDEILAIKPVQPCPLEATHPRKFRIYNIIDDLRESQRQAQVFICNIETLFICENSPIIKRTKYVQKLDPRVENLIQKALPIDIFIAKHRQNHSHIFLLWKPFRHRVESHS